MSDFSLTENTEVSEGMAVLTDRGITSVKGP